MSGKLDEHGAVRARRPRAVPFHRTVQRLVRDPLTALAEIGRESDGAVVRLHLGLFRPYLVTSPEHVQYVLRDGSENYIRDGMIWKPLRRLNGDGIAGDGPDWVRSRQRWQPFFAAKDINVMVDSMSAAITEALDALEARVEPDEPIDVLLEMTRVVHRVLARLFFGDRVSMSDADRLGEAINTAFTSLGPRMLLPFVPNAVPMPGDAAFRRAVRIVDEITHPLVQQRAKEAVAVTDIVARLGRLRDESGELLTDSVIRDDLNAMFVAGTETSALALTWIWTLLDRFPHVGERISAEVRSVIGSARPTRAHLAGLNYTKMALQETLRLYPPGWIVPRMVAERHVLGDTTIPRGATVLVSPFITHRMERHWDQPDVFDPDRFLPNRARDRHRFAYYPFGGGAHMCLGSQLFMVEATLILATLFSRYRPELCTSSPVEPQASTSLRPSQTVKLLLCPS